MRLYTAIVEKVMGSKDDGKKDDDYKEFYEQSVIAFRVPDLIDNLDEYPYAYPLNNKTFEVLIGQEVLIWQFDENLEEFFYSQLWVDRFVGIYNKNTTMDITDESELKITVGSKKVKFPYEETGADSDDERILVNIFNHGKDNTKGENRIEVIDEKNKASFIWGADSGKDSYGLKFVDGEKQTFYIDAKNKRIGLENKNTSILMDEDKKIVRIKAGDNVLEYDGIAKRFEISNGSEDLGGILKDILTELMQVKTMGAPPTHTISPSNISNFGKILGSVAKLFKL